MTQGPRSRTIRTEVTLSPILLVPLIVFGLLLVPTLSWAYGWSALASLTPELARTRFLVDHPEADVLDVTVAADGLSALVWLGDHAGIVFVVGDRFATRSLRDARIERTASGFRVTFPEFGVPTLSVPLASPVWEGRLLAA